MRFQGPKIEVVVPATLKPADLDSISFSVSPTLEETGCMYGYLLMGNLVYCISMTTGQEVLQRPLRPLTHGGLKATMHCIRV